MFAWLGSTYLSWGPLIAFAYVIGGAANCNLQLAMHEVTHTKQRRTDIHAYNAHVCAYTYMHTRACTRTRLSKCCKHAKHMCACMHPRSTKLGCSEEQTYAHVHERMYCNTIAWVFGDAVLKRLGEAATGSMELMRILSSVAIPHHTHTTHTIPHYTHSHHTHHTHATDLPQPRLQDNAA